MDAAGIVDVRAKLEVIEAEKARNAEYIEKRDKLTKIIASSGG